MSRCPTCGQELGEDVKVLKNPKPEDLERFYADGIGHGVVSTFSGRPPAQIEGQQTLFADGAQALFS